MSAVEGKRGLPKEGAQQFGLGECCKITAAATAWVTAASASVLSMTPGIAVVSNDGQVNGTMKATQNAAFKGKDWWRKILGGTVEEVSHARTGERSPKPTKLGIATAGPHLRTVISRRRREIFPA